MLQDLDSATARSAVLFSSLPRDLADDILRQSTSHRYVRGETIFVQGDTAQSIYVVLDGWVKLFRLTPRVPRPSLAYSRKAVASARRSRLKERPIL